MIVKLDHIGIAIKNIDEAIKLYTHILGLNVIATETMEEQKVKTLIMTIGESKIELLESTDPHSIIGKFIERKGEGLHHIALGVDNLEESMKALKARGARLLDEKPGKGVQNTRTAFLHPKETKVLLELVEIQR